MHSSFVVLLFSFGCAPLSPSADSVMDGAVDIAIFVFLGNEQNLRYFTDMSFLPSVLVHVARMFPSITPGGGRTRWDTLLTVVGNPSLISYFLLFRRVRALL